MKAIKIAIAAVVVGLVAIISIGSMLPGTEASKARRACETLDRMAYSQAEKARAEDTCSMLRKEADRRMGRLPIGAP